MIYCKLFHCTLIQNFKFINIYWKFIKTKWISHRRKFVNNLKKKPYPIDQINISLRLVSSAMGEQLWFETRVWQPTFARRISRSFNNFSLTCRPDPLITSRSIYRYIHNLVIWLVKTRALACIRVFITDHQRRLAGNTWFITRVNSSLMQSFCSLTEFLFSM